jgi:NADH-quinone oxidoreductase subunit N
MNNFPLSFAMLSAIVPQMLLAFGLVLSMLLVAWFRSRQVIQQFTLIIFLLAALAVYAHQFLLTQDVVVTSLLRVDNYAGVALWLILLSAVSVTLISHRHLMAHADVHDEYYLLLQAVVFGASILVVSDHFAALFLGFEIVSIALVGLVAYTRAASYAVETGFKYLILSATASSIMLLGIAYLYSATGNLSFTGIAGFDHADNALYIAGIILFLVGLAFKLSLAPFHYWTPDVYQGASTPVTMLLASVSKIAMMTVLLKFWFSQQYLNTEPIFYTLSLIALLSMFVGNVLALKQLNLKRLLGYASIAHMGYLVVVLLVVGKQQQDFAWQTALIYLTAYVLATLSMFLVLEQSQQYKTQHSQHLYHAQVENIVLDDWHGLFWRNRLQAIVVLIAVLSFAGIPLTAGFIAKFYLLVQASQQTLWLLIAGLIIGSAIGLFYYLRIIFVLFAPLESVNRQAVLVSAWPVKMLMYSLMFATLWIGVVPDYFVLLLK